MEITKSGQQAENQMKKHESNLKALWDNIKQTNLYRIGNPERKEKEKGIENILEEIMAENFPNLKETDIKIQRTQGIPKQGEPKQTHTKTHYNKDGKIKRKRENSKGSKRNTKLSL